MYEHVIVPVDLSHPDPERQALVAAKKILGKGGKLTLLHVIAPPHPSYAAFGVSDSAPKAAAAESVQRQLQKLIAQNDLPADTEIRIEHGRPPRVICDSVTDVDHQAIVMSSHNPTFTDFMLGSVAAQVVKHAECSVFIVRHSSSR